MNVRGHSDAWKATITSGGEYYLKHGRYEYGDIRGWLNLLTDLRALYENASDAMRRRLNQAIFKRICVVDRERAQSELSEPARALLDAQTVWQESILNAAPMQSPRLPTGRQETPANEEAAYSMHDGNVGVSGFWWT